MPLVECCCARHGFPTAVSSSGKHTLRVQDMLAATKTLPSALHYADVRDVGRAHILAAETPGASGRYIVGHDAMTPSRDITDIYQVPSSWQPAVRPL